MVTLLGPPRSEGPVVVRASFYLQDINAINDGEETFEFTGVLTLEWKDERQAYEPSKVGVEEKVYQGEFQFNEISPSWYPQVVLANASGMYEERAVVLRIRPDGTSRLMQTINAVAETDLNLRRYPLDRQRLEAVFEVQGFDAGEVVLEAQGGGGRPHREDIDVPQWRIERIDTSQRTVEAPYAGRGGRGSCLVLTIEARRLRLYMMRLVVLPLVLIVMLSWSVFWMDRSSLSDRLNVSFVGVLTAVAYLMVVSDNLPKISYVTLIHAFLSFSFIVMCGTVLVNLIVGACDRRGNPALGQRIDHCCRWAFPLAYVVLNSMAAGIAFFYY